MNTFWAIPFTFAAAFIYAMLGGPLLPDGIWVDGEPEWWMNECNE